MLFRCLLVSVCGVLAGCGEASSPALRIGDIQGSGAASPLAGQSVHIVGVVTGDFQDGDADGGRDLGGFFLQDLEPDGDDASSDGLFVYDREIDAPDVAVGDVVTVTGDVKEFHGETQLAARQVDITGSASAAPQRLELPAARLVQNSDGDVIADLEALEGMLVRLPGPLYVQDLRGLERFGEIDLSIRPREYTFTTQSAPDAAGFAAHREALASRTLVLDDGRGGQNDRPVAYLDAHGDRAPRVGDAVRDLVGVLRYSRGSGEHGDATWRLHPVIAPRFEPRNPRPDVPDVGGSLVVASFNVLNYFATPDNAGPRCGPAGQDACRGADSVAEFERQRARTARAIRQLDADIVGIMELENDASAALSDLLGALNRLQDGWAAVQTGVIGNDAIRVALLYRRDAVQPVGEFALLDSRVDARFNDGRNRPALAQTFATPTGARFTVAVNHLKSKGSPCDDDGDPDRRDGQGNCNGTRTAAAAALAEWLQGDPTGSGDADVLIIGDLNAYRREDPLRVLETHGFVNLLDSRQGEAAYSFVYDGQSGALDHALASPSLARQVTGIAEWHSNADEATVYDYNLDYGRDATLFDAAAPWRSADHDPLLIGLQLDP